MEVTAEMLRIVVMNYDDSHFRIVANGEIVTIVFEDRIFLYNRSNRHAFEVRPNYESGVMVDAL